MAVISPYIGQVVLIRRLLRSRGIATKLSDLDRVLLSTSTNDDNDVDDDIYVDYDDDDDGGIVLIM
jgi:predicted metal-dependent HD superfamily phosphohydrolase